MGRILSVVVLVFGLLLASSFAQAETRILIDVDASGAIEYGDGVAVDVVMTTGGLPEWFPGVHFPECTRCNAASIAAYIAILGAYWDIDGNGEFEHGTDGQWLIGWYFDVSQEELFAAYPAQPGCSRCTAEGMGDRMRWLSFPFTVN